MVIDHLPDILRIGLTQVVRLLLLLLLLLAHLVQQCYLLFIVIKRQLFVFVLELLDLLAKVMFDGLPLLVCLKLQVRDLAQVPHF